jgi:hypothetical protein
MQAELERAREQGLRQLPIDMGPHGGENAQGGAAGGAAGGVAGASGQAARPSA